MIDPTYMTEFTLQREWVEKRGFLLVLAFFLGGLGGGLYLVSLYLDFRVGLVAGFLIVAMGKTGTHLAYLGRPLRFWRAFLRPQNSWLSRGVIALSLFLVFAVLQLAPSLPQLSWLPWTSHNLALQILVTIGAVSLITYTGFVLGVVNAIPFWNTALMPILFIVYSLLGGSGLVLGIVSAGGGATDLALVESMVRWLLVITALILGSYLWVSYYSGPASKRSVIELWRGRASPYFLGGVVTLGLVIPLSIAASALLFELPAAVLIAGASCELIGGFSARYSILKAGVYNPLV